MYAKAPQATCLTMTHELLTSTLKQCSESIQNWQTDTQNNNHDNATVLQVPLLLAYWYRDIWDAVNSL